MLKSLDQPVVIQRITAVSYTHLDVYKRQVLGDRQLRDPVQFLMDNADPSFLGGFWAVKGRLFA